MIIGTVPVTPQFLTEHKETKGCSLVCNPSFLRFFVFYSLQRIILEGVENG